MKPRHIALTLTAFLLLALPSGAWAAVKHKVLHSFGSGDDGATPWGPLMLRGSDLYGVTISGGTGCNPPLCGTVFSLAPRASGRWKETILYNFPGGDYSYPGGGLVFDSAGNLYGIMGGYKGGVFELSPSPGGYNFRALYTDGAAGGLLMDDLGNLYGGMGPGQCQAGAIGELSPGSDGWTYTLLHSLCDGDGSAPPDPPIWDGEGNMFGTMVSGGISKGCWKPAGGCGTIYEMTPNGDGTWTYHVLHRFLEHNPKDGQSPYSGLVRDKAGNFYGATWVGGRYMQGTVYKLAYVGGHWKETILYDFPNCEQGCMVEGTLALDKAGNLYGTAAGGTGNCGYACGVVFKLSPQKDGKWKYSVVFDLTPETGGVQPYYGVILDGKGNLFGVTSRGGKYGGGTAFEITP